LCANDHLREALTKRREVDRRRRKRSHDLRNWAEVRDLIDDALERRCRQGCRRRERKALERAKACQLGTDRVDRPKWERDVLHVRQGGELPSEVVQ
jgi:hypothetical protein